MEYCRNTIVPELGLTRALFQGGVALGRYPKISMKLPLLMIEGMMINQW